MVIESLSKLIEIGQENISAKDIIEEGQITNKKGNLISARGLNSTLKALGFQKAKSKRIGDKTKRCIPLKNEHLEYLFKRYGVTVVTVVSEQGKIGKEPNLTSFDSNRKHRNNRNNVTQEDQELIPEEPIFDTIHQPCKVCGANPSAIFNKQGNPLCEVCFKAEDAQKGA